LYDYLKERQPALVHINYWVKQEDRFAECAIWFQTIFKICEELNFKVIQNVTIPAEPFISPVVQHNVFVSRFVADNFNIDPKTPSSVIYPGSDFTHFNNCDIETLPGKAIGMVYRLDRDKLNAEAIEVFISAVKKDRTIISYIVGGGYYLEQYKKRVGEEGLEKNFVFTGFVSYKQLPAHYRKMSVFVTPVHDESFGQVTPFAMSMGLSVAGYKVGALPEILGSTETLVEQGDIESLSQLIVDLTNDAERRLRLGRENQSRAVRYFSMETMIKEYSALYEMLTTGRPG
jgi:glycosyltransferase involved in cell wall biosynthesis